MVNTSFVPSDSSVPQAEGIPGKGMPVRGVAAGGTLGMDIPEVGGVCLVEGREGLVGGGLGIGEV